jgi:hypothetical protein
LGYKSPCSVFPRYSLVSPCSSSARHGRRSTRPDDFQHRRDARVQPSDRRSGPTNQRRICDRQHNQCLLRRPYHRPRRQLRGCVPRKSPLGLTRRP